jgi:hypothetical protein
VLTLSFNTASIVYEEPSREIPSSEILDKIENGDKIDYDDVTINGDLDLSRISLPLTHITKSSFELGFPDLSENARIIESPIIIRNSKINGDINFNDTIFKKSTNFLNTRIRGKSYFIDTQFDEYTTFAFIKFENDTYFDGANFFAYTDFGKSQFFKNASFRYSQFKGDLDIERAKFLGDLYFNDSDFIGYADFADTLFFNYTCFEGCNFRDDVGFEGCSFYQDINFSRAKFDRYVYFNNANIKGKMNLINTKLFIFLIDWNLVKGHILYDGSAYMQLIRNFKELEQFQDADDCYYQYRLEKQSLEPFGLNKLIDIFAFISCGYGVRFSHTIFSAIAVIILFCIYFALKERTFNLRGKLLRAKIIEITFFSAMILLSLPADWYPFKDNKYIKYKKINLYAIILERLIGWCLMLILIGVLTRIMIRY